MLRGTYSTRCSTVLERPGRIKRPAVTERQIRGERREDENTRERAVFDVSLAGATHANEEIEPATPHGNEAQTSSEESGEISTVCHLVRFGYSLCDIGLEDQ